MIRLLLLLLIFLPRFLFAQQEQIGDFVHITRTNPATGQVRHLLLSYRYDGNEGLGAVGWGCSMNGLTGMLITRPLEGDPEQVDVSYQFPPWPESEPVSWAGVSADGETATWLMPGGLVGKLRVEAQGKPWLTVRVTNPADGEILETTFGMRSFYEGLGRLPCISGKL